MATFRKRADKWQARVQRSGQSSLAKSFNTKADAVKWARHTESQLDLGTLAPKAAMPRLDRIVERYLAEVSPTKKGSKQELNRGRQIARTALGLMQLDKITSEVVSKYRDGRLRQVSNNTVRLELAFISVVSRSLARVARFATLARPPFICLTPTKLKQSLSNCDWAWITSKRTVKV